MTVRDRFDAFAAQFRSSAPVEKPVKATDPPHVTVSQSLVDSAKLASWIAFFALVYFLWLYTLDIAKDRAASLHITHAGQWVGDVEFWFPYIIGFGAVSVGIPYVAKIAIPVFMSLTWRENLWPKAWALFIAMAVSLVVIAGTFTVQGHSIVEKGRDAVVAEQVRTDAIATLERQKKNAQDELDAMTSAALGSRFQAQAARAGVEGWKATVAEAERRRDPSAGLMARQIGSAVAADAIRTRIRDLDNQIGAAPQAASVAARVETQSTGWIQAVLDWLEGTRAILLSLVMDVVCLLMPWIAQRLEQARNRQLAGIEDSIVHPQGARWADDAHMIPDFREEERPRAKPMAPNTEKVFDAETGEELVKIKPREYYRRAGKKKKGEAVEMPADPIELKDESGLVFDSDSRAARSGDTAMAGVVFDDGEGARSGVEGGDATDDLRTPVFETEPPVSSAENGAGEQPFPSAGDPAREEDQAPDADADGPSDTDDFLASLLDQDVTEEPAPEDKPLGAEGRDGVMIAAE